MDDMKELIKLYNNYTLRINIINRTYGSYRIDTRTSNKYLILDIITKHIEGWVLNISDLSNESEESIIRLNEYKEIFKMLSDNLLRDILSSKIQILKLITQSNSDKWSRTTGLNKDEFIKINTLSKLFDSIISGYSKLQNNYYINKLNLMDTYNNFPEDIFIILSKLQENNHDNMEKTINDINKYILNNLKKFSIDSSNSRAIYQGFLINSEKNNLIIQYCDNLISTFDYPKCEIRGFLHLYMLNRYNIILNDKVGNSNDNCIILEDKSDSEYIFYAYIYILDIWLCGWMHGSKFTNDWRNLYIINKSYNNRQLNPFIEYYNYKKEILALPIYIKELDENYQSDEQELSDYEDSISDINNECE